MACCYCCCPLAEPQIDLYFKCCGHHDVSFEKSWLPVGSRPLNVSLHAPVLECTSNRGVYVHMYASFIDATCRGTYVAKMCIMSAKRKASPCWPNHLWHLRQFGICTVNTQTSFSRLHFWAAKANISPSPCTQHPSNVALSHFHPRSAL